MDAATRENFLHGARNNRLFDIWSIVHLLTGVAMGWVIDPFVALVLMIAWEPFEIFLLGPAVKRLTGKTFGYESFRNSMSDILFDAAGVAIGAYLLSAVASPPFHWF